MRKLKASIIKPLVRWLLVDPSGSRAVLFLEKAVERKQIKATDLDWYFLEAELIAYPTPSRGLNKRG